MRRAARVDANHAQIRDGLRRLFWTLDLSRCGAGVPDLLVWAFGRLVFLECKIPKGGRLTEAQKTWHAAARERGVPVYVVHSLEEALDALGVQREPR